MIQSISDIPVLFFPFSRPEYARQTFEAIKKAKPKKFYFYCDKAREGNEEEIKNNNIIRDYIKEVDWDCDLKTWFRDENIGVYTSIMNAIDWFFDNEEYGIILEEDCLPSLAFFDFCRQLLPKYKDDPRVWFISGNNFLDDFDFKGYDYLFSAISFQWGWASWKSRWSKIIRDGFNVKEIIEENLHFNIYGSKTISNYTNKFLIKNTNKEGLYAPDSWDYIFQMSMHVNNGLAIIPKINLVSNIGVIGFNSRKRNIIIHQRELPKMNEYKIVKSPEFVVPNLKYMHSLFSKVYFKSYIKMILKEKLKLLISLLKKLKR